MNVLLIVGVVLYTLYTVYRERILLPSHCIIKLQSLSISLQMYFLAVICVGIDGAIAVFNPEDYENKSTMKLFMTLNIGVFAFLLLTQLGLPLLHIKMAFELRDKPVHCESSIRDGLKYYFLGNMFL